MSSDLNTVAQEGVYLMLGSEIYNHKELGLIQDKIYKVLRDEDFTTSIYEQLVNCDIPLRVKGINESVGVVENVEIGNGKIYCSFMVNSKDVFNTEVRDKKQVYPAIAYKAETVVQSGWYNNIEFDLAQYDPKLDSVYMVEKTKQPL